MQNVFTSLYDYRPFLVHCRKWIKYHVSVVIVDIYFIRQVNTCGSELNRHRYSVIYVHRTTWLFKIWKCFFHVLFQHAMAIRPKNSLLLFDRDTSGPHHKTLSHLLQPHPRCKGTLAIIFKLPKSHRYRFSCYADFIQYLFAAFDRERFKVNRRL